MSGMVTCPRLGHPGNITALGGCRSHGDHGRVLGIFRKDPRCRRSGHAIPVPRGASRYGRRGRGCGRGCWRDADLRCWSDLLLRAASAPPLSRRHSRGAVLPAVRGGFERLCLRAGPKLRLLHRPFTRPLLLAPVSLQRYERLGRHLVRPDLVPRPMGENQTCTAAQRPTAWPVARVSHAMTYDAGRDVDLGSAL